MAKRGVIRSFVAKARIPGVFRDGEDGLIQDRESPEFVAARARGYRRAGVRSLGQKAEDGNYRGYGIPVFDRRAGQGELHGYLSRGRRSE